MTTAWSRTIPMTEYGSWRGFASAESNTWARRAVPALVLDARAGEPGIFHHFVCWYRCSYALPLEPPPYISLSFLMCQEGKGRRGVNRMHLWPRSARFTCPLRPKRGLFVFPPGVTPVLTGRREPLRVPQVTQASLMDGSAGRQ